MDTLLKEVGGGDLEQHPRTETVKETGRDGWKQGETRAGTGETREGT